MKTVERNVVRLAVVQHLRATYGIKTKNWNKCKNSSSKLTTGDSVKVFGVALESLPHCHVLDYGDIPCFLVDACSCLLEHLDTEGLFRKSGSIVRVKALRAKLDLAEECLSTALPLDIAGLLKQFFRELPEPVLPTDLQSAFLKAQELVTTEERTSATVLLSCVLPQANLNTLRYFFSFLKRVAQRCADNKMDSSNLSVIFAPNLLHCGDGTEKMNASTEKKLKLQAAVIQCLIDNAQDLGVVPEFLMAKIPAMLGCETGVFSPSDDTPSGVKKSRRSLGDVVNGALNKLKSSRTPSDTPHSDGAVHSSGTPVIMTPKRKLPMESGQTYGFSNKKRRSLKMNLGLELFPNALFGGGSTPGSVHSASGVLDSSQNGLSSVGRSSRLSASSIRRKSKRLSHRNIGRVESGKAGCFSPRVTKKEAMRKSLRQRFSLGKPSRDCTVNSHSLPVPKGSEVIGWRLATQDSITSFHVTKETAFSPAVLRNSASEGSKYISKSEDNLLTPYKPKEPGKSWTPSTSDRTQELMGNSFLDTPMNTCLKSGYRSEPTIVISKPPAFASVPKSLCCATSSESLASSESFSEEVSGSAPTLLKIKVACDESGSGLAATDEKDGVELKKNTEELVADKPAPSQPSVPSENNRDIQGPHKSLVDGPNVTFGQIEIVPLSPLYIDSVLFDGELNESLALVKNTHERSLDVENESGCTFAGNSRGSPNCSRLIDALDIQSPVAFRLNSSDAVQSTPCLARKQTKEVDTSNEEEVKEPSLMEKSSESSQNAVSSLVEERREKPLGPGQPPLTRVAEHVQRFNMLTLNSPKAKAARSPLKFKRTPVRQSVRRFNSMQGQRNETRSGWCAAARGTSVAKTLSLESGLSTGVPARNKTSEVSRPPAVDKGVSPKPKSPEAFKKPNAARAYALGDVTNIIAPKPKSDATKSATSDVPKSILLHAAERDASHYRGSPRNPLMQGKLMSAMKPIDL